MLSRPGGASLGAPHKLHIYNSSGRGVWGFHYDPVFLVARSSPAASSSATPQASSAPSVRGSGDVDKLCALPGCARLSSQRGPRTLRRTGSAWPPTPGELRDGGVELLRARFAGVAVSAPDAANQSVAGSCSAAGFGQLPADARGTPASSQRCSAPGGSEAQRPAASGVASSAAGAPPVVALSKRGVGLGGSLLKRRR